MYCLNSKVKFKIFVVANNSKTEVNHIYMYINIALNVPS